MKARDRLIVALDVEDHDSARRMVDLLAGEVDIFKVGIAPFTGYGDGILRHLEALGKKVFLDLKFHDIPNTVRNAAREGTKKHVFMMNFHCLGGKAMLEAAVQGAGTSKDRPLLLGVTILTSMGEAEFKELGMSGTVTDKVLELARIARDAGLDGVVASAKEAARIKKDIGGDFVVVTPGVRPEWSVAGDQKRVLTPSAAINEGADYLVVGRPILEAEDPREAARKILNEMDSIL
ncbi:MAG: orotidine-5'-phosphate decarboxylase [Candidatus Omnitrophica bacterium]|nr:orotidine-5'-phosphate decarboxylase [Candidatus Omnitrophota bacterium]MDD5488341.1 orotidine-5'-phosphate decarboxylase [Candidatus Omnitrophota bacterium]